MRADAEGEGVVCFDVETTELVDEGTPIRDMRVSVACAMHVPRGCTCAKGGEVTRSTHWPEVAMRDGQREGEKLEKLLQSFDDAAVIVAYNGRSFDMQVMRQAFPRKRAYRARRLQRCLGIARQSKSEVRVQ